MRASAQTVEGNLVRLSVEVDEPEVDRALNDTVRTLTRQVRVPGFRPGKVPRRVLEARMGGAAALRAEALRDALPDFYAEAVRQAEVDPIAPPDIDITAGEESGGLAFDATVQVRPTVGIPGYAGLQVTVPVLEVSEEDISAQVDRLRENEGELVPAGRPASDGDHATIDIHGTASGEEVIDANDFLYEVGSGRVVPELDTELRGKNAGDIVAFHAASPDRGQISFRVLVKDVQRKQLPEATDEWAAEASEFSTIDELRNDIRQRVARVRRLQAQMALRQNALTALVDLVEDDEVPEVLVEGAMNQRAHDLAHRLEEQRATIGQYLAATGQSEEEFLAALRVEVFREVKADLALRALADAEELDISEDELAQELAAMAERMDVTPEELRGRLDRAGRMSAVRSEQKKAKAMAWLADHVEIVDDNGDPVSRDDLQAEDQEPGESQVGDAEGEPSSERVGDEVGATADDGAGATEATGEVER